MLYSIVVPICIVRAHGLRGLAYVAAHFVGMVLVLTISLFFTMLLFGKIKKIRTVVPDNDRF